MKKYPFIPFPGLPEFDEHQLLARSEQFYEHLKSRRTIREFSDRPIPEQVIDNCLLAAGTAPNGANLQPWHFAVVRNPEIKRQIREAAEAEEREFYSGRAPQEWLDALAPLGTDDQKPFLEIAPYLIVVFMQTHFETEDGDTIKHYYASESVGIATGMLITALHHCGIATLTHTPSPMRFLNEILGRPKFERPFLVLVTGYPAEKAMIPDLHKKSLEQIASKH